MLALSNLFTGIHLGLLSCIAIQSHAIAQPSTSDMAAASESFGLAEAVKGAMLSSIRTRQVVPCPSVPLQKVLIIYLVGSRVLHWVES